MSLAAPDCRYPQEGSQPAAPEKIQRTGADAEGNPGRHPPGSTEAGSAIVRELPGVTADVFEGVLSLSLGGENTVDAGVCRRFGMILMCRRSVAGQKSDRADCRTGSVKRLK